MHRIGNYTDGLVTIRWWKYFCPGRPGRAKSADRGGRYHPGGTTRSYCRSNSFELAPDASLCNIAGVRNIEDRQGKKSIGSSRNKNDQRRMVHVMESKHGA